MIGDCAPSVRSLFNIHSFLQSPLTPQISLTTTFLLLQLPRLSFGFQFYQILTWATKLNSLCSEENRGLLAWTRPSRSSVRLSVGFSLLPLGSGASPEGSGYPVDSDASFQGGHCSRRWHFKKIYRTLIANKFIDSL